MTTMTTEQALLAAVLADPADDLRRLVYADHLEERGEVERAEFVRVQLEMAKPVSALAGMTSPMPFADLYRLQDREKELFDRHKCEWFGERWAILNCGPPEEDSTANYPDLGHAFITRGFVSEYHAPLLTLVGGECGRCVRTGRLNWHDGRGLLCPDCSGSGRNPGVLRELVRTQPVGRVIVTGREPWSDGPGSTWFSWADALTAPMTAAPHYLPHEVYMRVKRHPNCPSGLATSKRYPTRESAELALSAALLAHARSQPA